MKRLLVLGVALLAASALTAVRPGVDTARAATVGVSAANYGFTPKDITITAGDTVEWNFSGDDHNVTSVTGDTLDSGTKSSGESYSFVFNTAGTYDYYCTFHGTTTGTGMVGSVIVTGAATATSTSTAIAGDTATPTRTPTPMATGTASATATGTPSGAPTVSTSGTSTPVLNADENLPPGSGAQPSQVRPPQTGEGAVRAGRSIWRWLSAALAASGVGAIAGAAVVWRRQGH